MIFAPGNRFTSATPRNERAATSRITVCRQADAPRRTATGLFRVESDRPGDFIKEWNKLEMWEQLGCPAEECLIKKLASGPVHRRVVSPLGASVRRPAA